MRPLRYVLKCFSLILIFFVAYQKSEASKEFDFTNVDKLEHLCSVLKRQLPKTEEECISLRRKLLIRYGEVFMEGVDSKMNNINKDKILKGEEYWQVYFYVFVIEADYVEPLFEDLKLSRIPVTKKEWSTVKKFITPLTKNIFDHRLKKEILSLLERTLNSESDYRNAFIELSELYSSIPASLDQAIMNYFGYSKSPDNLMDFIRDFAYDFVEIKEIAAFADVIAFAKSYMEDSESQVLVLNAYTYEDLQDIITKVVLLERLYGLNLASLKQPELQILRQSSIAEFLDIQDHYKSATQYKFPTESTTLASKSVTGDNSNNKKNTVTRITK